MNISGYIFTLAELITFGILLLVFIYQMYYYVRYINAVNRHKKQVKNDKISFSNEKPPVSVIICSKDDTENLRKFLAFVLNQDYPEYEVIVINDGESEETEDLLLDLKKVYPQLRSTFVPNGATNLSTKKLAISLGIKAAKYDLLLFTDADCMPEDKCWIDRMARNFTPDTDIVLGYGAYLNKKKSFLNKLITYDTLFIGLQYLGMAKAGKAYMGVGRNMAYRKEVFFKLNGFATTLHLRSGDDDLLINKAAKPDNTRIEVAADSITWSEPNTTYRNWYFQKERHLSVSSHYNPKSRYRLFLEPFTRGIFYLSTIAALLFGNWLTMSATGLLFLTRLVTQGIIINRSSKHFGERNYFFTLLLFDIYLPLVNLFLLTFGRMGKKSKYIRWK